jgi:hypothetical protein
VIRQALENAWMESHPLTMVGAATTEMGDAAAGHADADAGDCQDGVCRI